MKKNEIKKRAAQKAMVNVMAAAAEACARAVDNVEVPVEDAQAISSLVAICLELTGRTDPRVFRDCIETVEMRMKFYKQHYSKISEVINEQEGDTSADVEG